MPLGRSNRRAEFTGDTRRARLWRSSRIAMHAGDFDRTIYLFIGMFSGLTWLVLLQKWSAKAVFDASMPSTITLKGHVELSTYSRPALKVFDKTDTYAIEVSTVPKTPTTVQPAAPRPAGS
ncbi:MAG: hypothetical protein Q9182_007330 [Xanthomendoza sp. 2 TL-2023]